MKRNIIALAAVLTLLIAATAFAGPGQKRGGCPGYGGGPGGQALTAEQQTAMNEVMEKHREAVQPLHEKLWAKNAELKALSNNPNAQPSEIKALIADISELRSDLHDQRQELGDEIEKKVGIKPFAGRGCGAGFGKGAGQGRGQGPCGGGYGQGRGGCF